MKTFFLTFLLFIWFLLTMILCFSVIGFLLIAPQPNLTDYYKPIDEGRRSTWMQIGRDIKDKLLK